MYDLAGRTLAFFKLDLAIKKKIIAIITNKKTVCSGFKKRAKMDAELSVQLIILDRQDSILRSRALQYTCTTHKYPASWHFPGKALGCCQCTEKRSICGGLLPLKPQLSKTSCVTVTKKKVFGLSTISSEVFGFFLFSVDDCFFHCLTVFSHTTTHVFMCVSYILSLFTLPKKIKHQKQQLQIMTSVSGILQNSQNGKQIFFFHTF